MAARRVSKSSVDWSAYFSKTPSYQVDSYRALKAKNDAFVAKYAAFLFVFGVLYLVINCRSVLHWSFGIVTGSL